MYAFNLMWIYVLIPATVFLTASYFVLVANQKAASKGLQAFGRVIAMLLWMCAALMLLAGIYTACLASSRFCSLKSGSSYRTNPHKDIMRDPHHGMMMEPLEETEPEAQK